MDLVLRDLGISELYVDDRIQREATFSLLRTIVSQLEQIVPKPVERSTVPMEWRIGKLQHPDEVVCRTQRVGNMGAGGRHTMQTPGANVAGSQRFRNIGWYRNFGPWTYDRCRACPAPPPSCERCEIRMPLCRPEFNSCSAAPPKCMQLLNAPPPLVAPLFVPSAKVMVQLQDGALAVVDKRTQSVQLVFPPGFDLKSRLIINHVVDRAATGLSMFSFMASMGALWVPTWGWFHDLWNSIKNSCKAANRGRWWLFVLRFASIANLNHGPYRSGVWGKTKQTTLTAYIESRTSWSVDFRAAADRTVELVGGQPCDSDADYEYWFRRAARLPSCVSAGPVLKFARWMSIQECWDFYRDELWFLKEVLLEMNPKQAGRDAETNSTSMVGAEMASKMTAGSGGLIARAPTYITQELIDTMDMSNIATASCRRSYKHRAKYIKGLDEGIEHTLWLAAGGWEVELIGIIADGAHTRHYPHTLHRGGWGVVRARVPRLCLRPSDPNSWTQRLRARALRP